MKTFTLPNYEVLDELAKGGMSTIYRARQLSLGRLVALKILRNELLDNERVRQRFKREALAVSALSHENIVSVYDLVEMDQGLCLVMEYVEGINLQQVMAAAGMLHPALASLIFLQVARALEYAHREGFVHRDIKPANILINPKGVVKLADFGIVKASRFAEVTLPGTFLGTPRYMSPEQSLGMRLDFRSDLYSLGTCWYEAIYGRALFQGFTAEAIIKQVRHKRVIPLHRTMFSVPLKISKMITRCLQRKPQRRYRATGQLRKSLEREMVSQVGIDLREPLALLIQRVLADAPVLREQFADTGEFRRAKRHHLSPVGGKFSFVLARRLAACLLAAVLLAVLLVGLLAPQRKLPGAKGWRGLAERRPSSLNGALLDGFPLAQMAHKQSLRWDPHVLSLRGKEGARKRQVLAPRHGRKRRIR